MIKNLYENIVFNDIPILETDMQIEDNALKIMNMRYFIELPNGQKEVNYSQLCRRVARVIASGDYLETTTNDELKYIINVENHIYNDMMNHRFLFNSPALFSAGAGISADESISKYLYKTLTHDNLDEAIESYRIIQNNISKNQMMFACFTVTIPDSIEGIFDSVKKAATISKFGGGVGANFGNLREKGGLISGGVGGKASGPISFMENWNTMGATVIQGGKRRAALMGMLNIHHPDIEEFITCKAEDGRLNYFNVSVAIDDKFMEAVKNNENYDLYSPETKQVVKTVNAKNLWNKICESAHSNGDPGIFFVDTVNKDNLLKTDINYNIETTNPCLSGDTLIETDLGPKRIDEINKNDYVLTMDIDTKELIYEKVIFSGLTKVNANLIEIELEDSEILKLTPDHKVFTENRGYVSAVELTEFDNIVININSYCKNYRKDIKEWKKNIRTIKIKKINVIKNENVYDISVNKNHNFFANGILVHNCGEQPLANETSCNLGSINLSEFVTNKGELDINKFRSQILRSMYYLDLVIDVTRYPLDEIKEKTKDIRPVGLGVMGLADMCIKMGIKYGSEEFENISKIIAQNLSKYSLIATTSMAIKKGTYPHFENFNGERVFLNNALLESSNDKSMIDVVKSIIKDKDNNIPLSFKIALEECCDIDDYILKNEKEIEQLFKYIFNKKKGVGGLRNSRRLSIAPTGTISLLLNTSSSIEPNFAYEWSRSVAVNATEKSMLTYYHKLYSEYNKDRGLLISAHDVTPEQHVKVVSIFAPYIDSAISKTCNFSHEATVDDVKEVYEYCYENNIKGITIYRDGSRNNQPLIKKEEVKKIEESEYDKSIKLRPKFMHGITTKSDSPFGSIYITSNFDSSGKMFETFISAGKSGSVSKSITEALSRVISLALRSGVNIEDLIKTISNISGSEVWVYDTYDGSEIVVKSIPDATAKMLEDLNNYYKYLNNQSLPEIVDISDEPQKFGHYRNICPECGIKMIQTSGCSICMQCGYSDCK